MKQLFYTFSMSGIIAANFIAAYLIYLSFYPIKIVDLKSAPVVQESQVRPGDHVHVQLEFNKLKDYRSDIIWSLVNGEVYQIESGRTVRQPGEHFIVRSLRIPELAYPDTYHIEVDIEYTVLPWRKINYKWVTNSFEVINDQTIEQ